MISPNAKPEELLNWFLPIFVRALVRWDYGSFRETYECAQFTIDVEALDDDKHGDQTLPRKVRRCGDKIQDVFRAIFAIWHTPGREPVPVMPKEINDWLNAYYQQQEPNEVKRKEAARSTTHHALTELQRLGIVYQHDDGGWMYAERPVAQGTIDQVLTGVPNENGTPCPLEHVPTIDHASRVAEEDRAKKARAEAERLKREDEKMRVKHIWVPGDPELLANGSLCIRDVKGTPYLAESTPERMRFENDRGRKVYTEGVRCELVGIDHSEREPIAIVKLLTPEGKKQIRVRVIGDWQLEGRLTDQAERAEADATK